MFWYTTFFSASTFVLARWGLERLVPEPTGGVRKAVRLVRAVLYGLAGTAFYTALWGISGVSLFFGSTVFLFVFFQEQLRKTFLEPRWDPVKKDWQPSWYEEVIRGIVVPILSALWVRYLQPKVTKINQIFGGQS